MLVELDQSRPVAARVPIPGVGTTGAWLRPARWLLTTAVLLIPVAALVLVLTGTIADAYYWPNLVLAVVFYVVIGHGVTVGFHRLFTHKSFEAKRPLKVALAVLGSMGVEGSVIGWVADHRRHHRFVEQDGDPHSPARPETQRLGRLRGLVHAHMGWFYKSSVTSREKYAPDLLADRDLVIVDRLFIPLATLTFLIPFGIGYAITGRFSGGLAAFIWAGVLRVGLFHHMSWCTNSLCHVFGKRPFRTTDQSTNFAPLAPFSMGEAWHNAHHAFPTLARHGVDRGQLDTSASIIRAFERLGWAMQVRWPDPARLATRRIS
jgi:stearoyl-CoA desaturase (delta-9 desaturase)